MDNHGTLVHAIVGAIVGILLSFIPFSTVIGGAVAGFLEGPAHREGALAGALAGAITFLPVAGIALLAFAFVGFGTAFAAFPIEGAVFLLVAVLFGFATILIYTVGLALVGGLLGAAIAREYPDRRVRTRRSIGLSDRPRAGRSTVGGGTEESAQRSREWTGGPEDPQPWDDPHESQSTTGPEFPGRDRRSTGAERDADDQARRRDERSTEPDPERAAGDVDPDRSDDRGRDLDHAGGRDRDRDHDRD